MTPEEFLVRLGQTLGSRDAYLQLRYEDYDDEHRNAPADGPGAIDVLLGRALLATRLRDHDEARKLVVRATRLAPGSGAPAPPVLRRALGLLSERVFALVEADRSDDFPWFDALESMIERPGDDATVLALGAMQTVAAVRPLPWWLSDRIKELVEENWGPDESGLADRVLAGRSDERDAVLAVLRLVVAVDDFTPDEDDVDEDDGFWDGEA